MPAEFVGAYVPAFALAEDGESACRLIVARIVALGYEFIDIPDGKAHELNLSLWEEYVQKTWPDFTDHFPTGDELIRRIEQEGVFFGPFASYERKSSQPSNPADA